MTLRRSGPWSATQTVRFLENTAIPLRLACNGEQGHPVLASLWFVREGDRLWCATQRSARVAILLARDPRCAFEVARESPPYSGVRGQAEVTLHPERGREVLQSLIERYVAESDPDLARWLLSRADEEIAIALEPRSLLSWDYGDRMAPAS